MFIKKKEISKKEIIDHWTKNINSLDWRDLPTKREKKGWLQACLLWTGLPKRQIGSGDYVIDGNQINSTVDFYCILGESFFGYRGYFGQDSHGFNDCFSEIALFETTLVENGATVIFNNVEKIKKAVKEEEYSEIIRIFGSNGFNMKIE